MNLIKKTLLLFILPLSVFGQRPAGTMPDAARGRAGMPSIGRVYGKVIDANSGNPVEFSTVTLLAINKDSIISGALAKPNGDFSLDKLPFGRFRLRISFIGYKTSFLNVVITPNNLEQDLGNIKLDVDAKALKEAVIEGERNTVIMTIDRRIYTVDKDISARGGSGIDAVKNIPGITVDADGAVTLRNGSPTVFVDGRPTLMTLEQIPADQIERIEVITNPSAKFDASTSGGILNVVLKKNTKPGYNGLITLGAGFPNRQNAMFSLNIKEGRANFGISYNLNRSFNPARGYTNRTNFIDGIENRRFNQNNENDVINLFQNGRLSFDYNLSNRSTITIAQSFMSGGFDMEDKQRFSGRDSLGRLSTDGTRDINQITEWKNYSTQVQFRKTFPKKGKELTTDFTYNHSDRKSNSDFNTITNLYNPSLTIQDFQKNLGSGINDNFTFQLDFVNPITDTAKWEFGIRSNFREDRSKLDVSIANGPNAEYLADTSLTNDYKINELINAAYVTYSNMYKGYAYQVGLRFEQTRFTGELVGKNQRFEFYYPDSIGNLAKAFFPSLFITKRIGEKHEFQLNFTRKINRPGFMQAMPFIMFADKFNYRIGNPNLSPEFINTIEANYNKIFPKGNFFTSVYFKAIENPITNFTLPLASDTTNQILLTTFINGNTQYNFGWEKNLRYSFLNKKLDFTFNLNTYYTRISAVTGTQTIRNSGINWNTKAIISYKLPKSYTVQVNGSYEAPRIIPQGTTLDVYSVDFSIAKEVMKFMNINLIVNDVFNTRRFGTFFESASLNQEVSRRREVRFIRLSVTIRFGEMDASIFRKRSQRRGEGGGGMDIEY